MKLLSLAIAALAAPASAFTRPPSLVGRSAARTATDLSVSLPRIDLPPAVTEKLGEFGLRNPNEMDDQQYRAYSGAAIAGTLAFFLLPGAALTGLADPIGDVASAAVTDFALSAVVGGGAAIYVSLRDDEAGMTARSYGKSLLDATGLPTLRYDLPGAVSEKITGLGLLDPNGMDERDYAGYSGAAVAGTLAFFLLPGAAASGEFDLLGELGATAVKDFVFAALVGGGAAIYLALRKDGAGDAVGMAGEALLDAVDGLVGDSSKNLPSSPGNEVAQQVE